MSTLEATEVLSLSSDLADFASGLRWQDIPAPAQLAARRTVANVVGLAINACRHEAVEAALSALHDLGMRGKFCVLGRSDRLAIASAAFVNGVSMHVEDFDDTHLRTVVHPGAPIVPAAFAVAELTGRDGAEVLAAITAGVEVACRVGIGLGAGHFDIGWHLTGTMGHLGAAAAAGRLLRLDADRMRDALAIAATQASGHTEQLGTMSKPMHPGKAAADGVEAALLAAAGIGGPQRPIEGRRGLGALMAPAPNLALALDNLGTTWEIEENAFKPYSCGIVSHPVIDAAIGFRGLIADPDTIEAVEIVVRPVVLDVMGIKEPDTGLRSKFSVFHCFAVGFVDGEAGPAQYSDARATDATIVRLRQKIRATTDPSMPKDACRVTVRTTDGVSHHIDIDHASGSRDRPLTNEQLRAKFESLVRPVLGNRTEDAWERTWRLDESDGVHAVFRASQPLA